MRTPEKSQMWSESELAAGYILNEEDVTYGIIERILVHNYWIRVPEMQSSKLRGIKGANKLI